MTATSGEAVVETFSPVEELRKVLADVGLDPKDTGGQIDFTGQDPIVESVARVGAIGAIATAARSVAVASLWRDRTGQGQEIHIDLRKIVHGVSPFWRDNVATINGYPVRFEDPYNAFNADYYKTRDGRFVTILNPTVSLRERALRLLQCRNTRRSVAEAIGLWDARELESAAQAAGVACVMIRTPQEWQAEPQYQYLCTQPLISLTRIGDSPPEPLHGSRPLSSVRALGVTHELAGPQIGSGMAEHGADVLSMCIPWSPEPAPAYVMGNLGLRSAALDIDSPHGRERLHDLVRSADVVFHNRRSARMDRLGLSPQAAAELRPGIIHVSISAFGNGGPWSGWGGFDPHAISATGYATLEGTPSAPKAPPTLILNDFVAGWLGAAGAIAALRRRANEGGSWQVHVSLARCSMWFMELGLFDKQSLADTISPPLEPTWIEDQTPLGKLRIVAPQVEMTETPPSFASPYLYPRGSQLPAWRDNS